MQLQDMGVKPYSILLAILAIGPIVAAIFLQRQAGTVNHFAFWGILIIVILTFGVMGVSMLNRSAIIQGGELRVTSTFYSTTISMASITDVRTVLRGSEGDLVRMRVNGIGLPGFESGWFNSRAGGRLFVDRVAGDYLLVSVNSKPRLALEFSDNEAAARTLAVAVAQIKETK